MTAEHDTRYRKKIDTLEHLKAMTDDAQRAEILAASGQWSTAAEAFGKAVRRDPKNHSLRYQHIFALSESGNREGVRCACTDLLKSFGDATDPAETRAVAGFCRMAADAVGDHQKLDALRGLAAEMLLRELLNRQRAQLGADDSALANTLGRLARNLLTQKKWAETEPIARECLVICEKAQPDVWNTFNAKSMLGGALLGQKKYAEAEPLLLQGYEGMKRREKTIPSQRMPLLPEALERLVRLYEAMGKQPEAAKWSKELEAAKAAQPSTGPNHP
jgi:tetratricopeptide (TPR) repeat protein